MWIFFAILFCIVTSIASSFYFAFISVFPLETANTTATNAINTATNAINTATNVVNSTN